MLGAEGEGRGGGCMLSGFHGNAHHTDSRTSYVRKLVMTLWISQQIVSHITGS